MQEMFECLQERLPELSFVFEKAKNNEMIHSMIEELVKNAIIEARAYCASMNYCVSNKQVSVEEFDDLDDWPKSYVICDLGEMGLTEFLPNSIKSEIDIKFSAHIQNVLSCTMLVILNKLENLDGAINVFSPEVKITVQAPLGGKKGLTKCYMLMQLLYPWCKGISETSTNEVSVTIPAPNSDAASQKQTKDSASKTNKESFWRKFFKR